MVTRGESHNFPPFYPGSGNLKLLKGVYVMNKKEFNSVVQECKSSTCYYCGAVKSCNELEKVGFKTPFITFYSSLTNEQKQMVQKAKRWWEE